MPLTERDVNVSHGRRNTETPSAPNSKLPRRVATPDTAPSSTRWNGRAADRVAATEKAASAPPACRKFDAVTISSYQKKREPAAKNKPLPNEKPLPSRPIARLSNSLSPSKDSRGLIDADEKSLQFTSVTGDKREWPALQPQNSRSASSASSNACNDGSTTAPATPSSPAVTPASILAAATELTNVITRKVSITQQSEKHVSHSSVSSYASATESSSPANMDSDPSLDMKKTRDDAQRSTTGTPEMTFPERVTSLRNRISTRSLESSGAGSLNGRMGFTDFTRTRIPSLLPNESRPHSPSPASFSRPRPGSVSTPPFSSRALKTASRIPVSDAKKATVVEVTRKPLPAATIPKSALGPKFGSRRIASPEALKVLEEGKVRRLKRTPANENTTRPALERTWTAESNATSLETPSLSHSHQGSSDDTLCPSSPETSPQNVSYSAFDHFASPPDQSPSLPRHEVHGEKHIPATPTSVDDMDWQHLSPCDSQRPLRPPPQTSPFTGPLQTIPSEAILSANSDDGGEEQTHELTRTLSHLEGKGSPPKTDVDSHALLAMFGHLRKDLEKNIRNSVTFADVAAAEKYLALQESRSSGKDWDRSTRNSVTFAENVAAAEKFLKSQVGPKNETITGGKELPDVSKWSNSTPSDKARSPSAEELASGQPAGTGAPAHPSRDAPSAPDSIDFPSRIPSGTANATCQTHDEGAEIASIPNRRSSPTLGSKRRPGSVRAAREALPPAFARTTTSAESRKVSRLPAPKIKASSIPNPSERGRKVSSTAKPRSKSDGMVASKNPRSRSKSRYVLDKINGLFSGKREKKAEEVPPVPQLEKNETKSDVSFRGVEVSLTGSPIVKSATPQLPKMSSLSPSSNVALRSFSQATNRTDDDTLVVDGMTKQDDSQSVQKLSEQLVGSAQREANPVRRERLLNFAKVLNDSLISARQAQISAETALHAAKSAQVSYEMTQKSLAMLHKLAKSMARNGGHGRG